MKKKTFVKITERKNGEMVARMVGDGWVILEMLQTALARASLERVEHGDSLEALADEHREAVLSEMKQMLAEREGESLKAMKEMVEGLR